MKIKKSAKKFEFEFKKSLSSALIAAFGFIIALSWRGLIEESINTLTSMSPIQSKLFSTIIITIISVIGILLVTKLFYVDNKIDSIKE